MSWTPLTTTCSLLKPSTRQCRFVEQINEWIDAGYLPEKFTHTEIERIRLDRPDLDWRTKLEREPAFIERLYADGEAAAEAFLERRARSTADPTS